MKKEIYRIPPCAFYDVDKMESWFADMAEQGMLLKEFSYGLAIFECDESKRVQYHLEPTLSRLTFRQKRRLARFEKIEGADADKKESMEEKRRNNLQNYGWEYITTKEPFSIYRTEVGAPNFPVEDPRIAELTADGLRRHASAILTGSLIGSISVIYYIVRYLFPTMLNLGSILILFGLLLLIWFFIRETYNIIRFFAVYQLYKKGRQAGQHADWQRGKKLYIMEKLLLPIFFAIWLVIFFTALYGVDNAQMPLDTYTGEPPFVTLSDLVPGGEYTPFADGEYSYFQVSSDVLAPNVIKWKENAQIAMKDGKPFSAIMDVEYYETAAPWIAHMVALQYHLDARMSLSYEKLDTPVLDADYAVLYTLEMDDYPTLIVQKGTVVAKISFWQTSPDYQFSVEEWTKAMTERL